MAIVGSQQSSLGASQDRVAHKASVRLTQDTLQRRLGGLRKDLSADEFMVLRRQKFAQWQKTPEYAERLEEARSDLSAKEARSFLFEYSVEEYMAVEP